jgi:hypothetical protein
MDATLTIAEGRPATLTRLWTRLVSFVAMPGDDDEALRKKRLLLVVVLAKAPAARRAGASGLSGLTVASVIAFLVTRNFDRFRFQQTLIIFLGPIALHYFLGGFVNSSGVILSSFLAPLIAILFHGTRQSWPWFVALWIALLILTAADATLAPQAHPIPDSARVAFFLFQIGGVGSVVYAAIRYHASLLAAEKTEQVVLNERLRLTAGELSHTLARLEDTNVALAEAGRQKSHFLASSLTSCARRSMPSSAIARCSRRKLRSWASLPSPTISRRSCCASAANPIRRPTPSASCGGWRISSRPACSVRG